MQVSLIPASEKEVFEKFNLDFKVKISEMWYCNFMTSFYQTNFC